MSTCAARSASLAQFTLRELPYDLQSPDPVPIFVTVDGVDALFGVIPECNEDNNTAGNANAQCVVPG